MLFAAYNGGHMWLVCSFCGPSNDLYFALGTISAFRLVYWIQWALFLMQIWQHSHASIASNSWAHSLHLAYSYSTHPRESMRIFSSRAKHRISRFLFDFIVIFNQIKFTETMHPVERGSRHAFAEVIWPKLYTSNLCKENDAIEFAGEFPHTKLPESIGGGTEDGNSCESDKWQLQDQTQFYFLREVASIRVSPSVLRSALPTIRERTTLRLSNW